MNTATEKAEGASGAGPGTLATQGKQLRGSSLLLVGRVLSKFVNFGVQVGIVRLLSKGEFGVFAYGLALVLAGELVVKFGLGRGANRFVPYHAERREYPEVMGTLALVCSTIVVLGVLGFFGVWAVSGLGWGGMPSGEGARVILILSILAPIQALDTIGIQTLACFSRPRDILFRKHVLGPGLRAAAVGLVWLLGGDAELLALAYLGGGVLGLMICAQMAWRQLKVHGVLPLPMSAWRVNWRPIFRFSIPLMSSDLVFITLTFVTTVVLMETDGTEAVAAMRAVVPAAALIGLVVQSFSMLFMPHAMRLHAQGDQAGLRDHHWMCASWVAVLSFPLFGLTFAIAPGFVPIVFGEAYASSAELLAILAIGHYVSVCMAFNSETLQVFERIRAIVQTDFVVIAIGALLTVLLCPEYGALGAACAVTVARLSGAIGRQFVLLRTPGMRGVPSGQTGVWMKLALATSIAAFVGWGWQPDFVTQIVILAVVSLALLRSTAGTLDLAASFPELLRVPLVARVVGV